MGKPPLTSDTTPSALPKAPGVPYRTYFCLLAAGWSAVVAGSLLWNMTQQAQEAKVITAQTAKALLEKDVLYREWSILNGSVYVSKKRTTEREAHHPNRDIVTPQGETITLLNPVDVSREIFKLQDQQLGVRGRLASLNPIDERHRADPWEAQALKQFEQGTNEVSAVVEENGQSYFRLMRPLYTVQSCYRCHEEQGRKEGSVRGGISVMVPMEKFKAPAHQARMALAHLGLWLVGLAGFTLMTRNLRSNIYARQRVEAERELLIAELQEALNNVKTLRGLIPICASCKRIRDDKGYWTQIEHYLQQHSDAEFSHGICLECMRKLYPDIADEVEARLKDQGVLDADPSPKS